MSSATNEAVFPIDFSHVLTGPFPTAASLEYLTSSAGLMRGWVQGLSMGADHHALLFILGRVSEVSSGTLVITEITISRPS